MTRPRKFGVVTRIVCGAVIAIVALCGLVVSEGVKLSSPAIVHIGPPPADMPGAEAVQFPSASGSLIKGWWFPGGQPGGGTIVMLPGLRGNRTGFIPRAKVLHDHGYSVLLFDFQATGDSPGKHITFGYLEARDAAAAVDYARSRAPGEKVGIVGTSLGGAAAVLGDTPLPVNAMVLESTYPDIDSALRSRLRIGFGPCLGPALTMVFAPLLETLMPPILGATPAQMRPIDGIAHVTAPLLIISGTADTRTPLSEAQAIYARAPEPKQFWWVEGAGHTDLEAYDPTAYWSHVLPFLAAHLQTGN